MKRTLVPFFVGLCGWTSTLAAPLTHWPQFRGPFARGVAQDNKPPVRWNAETGQGLRWKTPIPGLGLSSPVIWADRLFVTTAIPEGHKPDLKIGLYGDIESVAEEADKKHRWVVYCLDKRTGKILWERVAAEGVPKFKRHPKSSHANCTAATDGRRVVVCFGAEGLFCYDFEGALQWKRDLGALDSGYYVVPEAQWGFGSSPVIHEGRVIVQCDVQKNSFLAAYDLVDGHEIWRVARDDVPSWSTPTIDPRDGETRILVNGHRRMAGYDFATGREIWRLGGGGDIPVPTPVVDGDVIFLTNAHGKAAPIFALRANAKGDLAKADRDGKNEFLLWGTARRGNYMQTPLVVGDWLFCCHDSGVATCYDKRTGENLWQERLPERGAGYTASPVSANGFVYWASETGTVHVVKAASKFGVVASNSLGEPCMATPAISEDALYFRCEKHVIAISE